MLADFKLAEANRSTN